MNTHHHVLPIRLYLQIFAALMVLLVATVAVAFLPFGDYGIVVAMTIAIVKALLVVLYFMHVRYSSKLVWVFSGAAFFWLAILLVLTMSDYATRGWIPETRGWDRPAPMDTKPHGPTQQ
jgi:cytochrome c oxidase subunit 4